MTAVLELKIAVQAVVSPIVTTGIVSEDASELLEGATTEKNHIENLLLDLKVSPEVDNKRIVTADEIIKEVEEIMN